MTDTTTETTAMDTLETIGSVDIDLSNGQDIKDTMAEQALGYGELQAAWAEAIEATVNNISESVNGLIDSAEDLDYQHTKLDLETEEEIVTFICDNIYFDGVSVSEMYPEI